MRKEEDMRETLTDNQVKEDTKEQDLCHNDRQSFFSHHHQEDSLNESPSSCLVSLVSPSTQQ
jgi:hypothetical protein